MLHHILHRQYSHNPVSVEDAGTRQEQQQRAHSEPVADPDLELRGGGGRLDLLAMAAIFLSVISYFFTQNKGGGGAGPPGPSPRSATVYTFMSGPLFRIKSLANVGSTTGILVCRIFKPARFLAQFVSVASRNLCRQIHRYCQTTARETDHHKDASSAGVKNLFAGRSDSSPAEVFSRYVYPTTRNVIFCSPVWTDVTVAIYDSDVYNVLLCTPQSYNNNFKKTTKARE